LLEDICSGFENYSHSLTSLENVRDEFRHTLDSLHLDGLQWGQYTSVVRLLLLMFTTPTEMVSSQLTCSQGHVVSHNTVHSIESCVLSAGTNSYTSIADWIRNFSESSHFRCGECNQNLLHTFSFSTIPPLELQIDSEVLVTSRNHQSHRFRLQDIIYYGENHYTSRIIFNRQLWFHDGISTGTNMIYDGQLQSHTSLTHCRGKQACVAFYT
jgi:hypothetical protein